MALEIWIPLLIWLGLGAVIALYLYRHMDKEGKVEMIWVIVGFLLSVLGLLAFMLMRSRKERARDKAVDPKSYAPPAYKMQAEEEAPKTERPQAAEPKPETAPKKEVKQIEGIPRCPSCGAAISHVDKRCPDCGAKLKD